MMTTHHIHCGAVVRTSLGVSEVPGLNPGGGIFSFFLIRPITITLIIFIFHFYSGWSLGVAVLGIYVYYTMGVISGKFFLLSVGSLEKNSRKFLAEIDS